MFYPCVLLVRVFLRVLISNICSHSCRDFLGNQPVYPIAISPSDVAKLIVESFEDIAEPIKLWFWLESTGF